MSDITIKKKKDKTIITKKISYPQMLFERELKIPATMDCFLPLTVKKKGKVTFLECVVQGLKPLNWYRNTTVTKAFFLSLVDQMVSVIINCKNYAIHDTNIDLNYDRVFIDPQGKVKCILWPVTGETDFQPKDMFFNQLISVFRFDDNEDIRFLNDYYAFFDTTQPFSTKSFQKLITRLMGKEDDLPSRQLDNPKSAPKPEPEQSSIEYDPFKETVLNAQQEKYVYEDESDQRVYKAWLVRERTDEKINIERGRMVIGRSKSLCDYIIFGNETISRRHVFIQNDGHRCVVIDNNSTNFTFLNASKIDPNKEYELSDGDSIRLSNEKFIFHEKFE